VPRTSWDLRLTALTAFIDIEGREPSSRAAVPGEHRLALWLEEQRASVRAGRLDDSRLDELRSAGLIRPEGLRAAARTGTAWLRVASVADFLAEEGRLPSLTSPTSAGERRLAAWMHAQLSGRAAETEPVVALRRILSDSAFDSRSLAHVG
jgi:hypothetical protein